MKHRILKRVERFVYLSAAVFLIVGMICEVVDLRGAEEETTATEEISGLVESPPIEETIEVIEEIKITAESTAAEITEPVETQPEETICYDNVPLDKELQNHIISECERENIDPAIVFAVIHRESRYTVDIMGDNGRSYGLMQIQLRWHSGRMEKLGCTDLLDPYQNVTVGINYLSELYNYYGDIGLALTAYNGGYKYADKYKAKDTISNYAKAVLTEAERISNG